MSKRLPPRVARFGIPALLGGVLMVVVAPAARDLLASRERFGRQSDGTAVLPTNQSIRPIGRITELPRMRPKQVAVSPDGRWVAVLGGGDWSTPGGVALLGPEGVKRVVFTAAATGLAWSPDGRALFASATSGEVLRIEPDGRDWKIARRRKLAREGNPQANGLAVTRSGRLFVALGLADAVAELDATTLEERKRFAVGRVPYNVVLSPDGNTLAVACRAGQARQNVAEEDRLPDGSVALIDVAEGSVRQVVTGREPMGMAFVRDRLYVACGGEDAVDEVAPAEARLIRRIPLVAPNDPGFGTLPTDVLPLADGRLAVACAGLNAIALLTPNAKPKLHGYVPTGWFPVSLAADGGGGAWIACGKGWGGPIAPADRGHAINEFIGTVQRIDAGDLRPHREVARRNNFGKEGAPRKGQPPRPMPERTGEPSVFDHVVYIIKENLTYDSVLGDLPQGDGAKDLCLFPRDVTPNHHALATEFVLLDNVMISGTNSADGHQWAVSSVATATLEGDYSAYVRSYPFNGGDPLAAAPSGYLWEAAARAGKSVRVFGEFANRTEIRKDGKNVTWAAKWAELWEDRGKGAYRVEAKSSTRSLRPYLNPEFAGYMLHVPDQLRADAFLREFEEWKRRDKMPDLAIIHLPNDHTAAASPDFPTPQAMVADNDLALGRIVEAITRSRFWSKTLILVIEDDSQLALDHVDGRRTYAAVVSPYTRRGSVNSELYNQTSFVRAIGKTLGLPPMTRFERTADPLVGCFTTRMDDSPFQSRVPSTKLNVMNPKNGPMARASREEDWRAMDRVDPRVVLESARRSAR